MTEDYPLPDMETLFQELEGSKFYVKIDLSSAQYQVMLDDAAQEIWVINTTLGLFKLLRLPQGMKNAFGMFQRTIENTLKGLAGTICFQDNVLVHGRTKSQCEKRWRAVQDRLKDKGFTINEFKSGNVMENITFLGFTISGSGSEPDDCLVKKIRKIQPPESVKEVKQFCGLVNFYGRFISNFTSKIAPISDLRKKSEAGFQWTDKCQRAFKRLKSELASKPVVQPYSLKKEVTITTDASERAIGGVLSQEGHPVIYVSKSFFQAEQRYSNIEREALADGCFCGRTLEAVLIWPEIQPRNRSSSPGIHICSKQGTLKNRISKIYMMGNFAYGFWLSD